jgi:hypothetical protein
MRRIKPFLLPTWRKVGVTLLLILMAAIQVSLLDTSSGLVHAVNQKSYMLQQKEYREKVRAVSERFSCERDKEIEKIPYPGHLSTPFSSTGITVITAISMLLVFYLFACIVLHVRRPIDDSTTAAR